MRNGTFARARLACVAAACGVIFHPPAAAADTKLIDAVKRQDGAAVRALVKTRTNVNAAEPDGTTAVHWAAYHDDAATLEVLLRAGANVDAATDSGVTPLWLACSTNASALTIRRLLDARANPNLTPTTGETPLMWCARAGAVESVSALVRHGAKVDARENSSGQTALMWAVAARHPDVVERLIEAGADARSRTKVTSELVYTGYRYITSPPPNVNSLVVNAKRGGFTPVLFAAQQGDRRSVELLLAAGADVNDADASGASVLVIAIHSGHIALARMFLERGADPNAAGAGYTALHAAVLRGDAGLVRALLASGANPNAQLEAGTPIRKYGVEYALNAAWIGATPYWLAAKFAELEMMRVLAEAGADTRRALVDGTTPLMATLMPGQAQGDRRERFQTEVQMAAAAGGVETATVEAVTLALGLGADINATTNAGDTALHLAATRTLIPLITLLVTAGAALEAENKNGQTPLDAIANRRRLADIDGDGAAKDSQAARTVELLRSLGAKERNRPAK